MVRADLDWEDSGRGQHKAEKQATTSTEPEPATTDGNGDKADADRTNVYPVAHTSVHSDKNAEYAGDGRRGVISAELTERLDTLQQSQEAASRRQEAAMRDQEAALRDLVRTHEERIAALEAGLHSRLEAALARLP